MMIWVWVWVWCFWVHSNLWEEGGLKAAFFQQRHFNIRYASNITVHVSREAPKCFTQKLLTVLQETTLNAKDNKTKHSSMSRCKNIYKRSKRNNRNRLNQKSLFVTYSFLFLQEKKHDFHMKNSVEFFMKQTFLSEAMHVFTKPKLFVLGSALTFGKPSRAPVYLMRQT